MNENLEKDKLNLAPNINIYVSAYKYLSDYYEYRKNLDSKFSYEVWAIELGFQSKSSVSMVCRGQKPISDSFVESFSLAAKFNAKQKDYFYLLANYQNAKKPILKQAYLDKIIEHVDTSVNTTELKNYIKFLSSPALPILQLIISFKDFKATESKITDMMALDSKVVTQHLRTLESIGLAQAYFSETEQEPIWTSCIKYFKISDRVHAEALDMFHQFTTTEACEALNFKNEFKKFKSMFFSLNAENFSEITKDFEEFFSKIKFKYGNDYLMNKQLFKVNLQVYPVTKKLQEEL